jgi:hypothetical protein
MAANASPAAAAAPRIVNIYNFIRNADWRTANSEQVLFDCTQQEVRLFRQHKLPVTWALQYDAMMNPRYQALLKTEAGPDDEIAAWWELPRPLVEKAGIKWRSKHDWDSASNIGFSPGYTPDERRKLVDVYMADFKAVFGRYPATVGSWYIDEVTLAYMTERYGIVASCNCKDQIGTDGYTLWGGYWSQAYYPSRLDAYMPAQTKEGQIDVPVFRMLGSDPIYQFGNPGAIFSLEPAYGYAGGSSTWVDWFIGTMSKGPCLAFGFAQAGQENSFAWPGIKRGLTLQAALYEKQSAAGEIRVETLEQSGRWFHSHFPLTPATSFVATTDWRHEGRKSVWYDSRYYRVNMLWEADGFRIRDLHRFDEHVVSQTHDVPLRARSLAYGTLPIIDAATWTVGKNGSGGFPVTVATDGSTAPIVPEGDPVVTEANATDLSITQAIRGGGTLSVVCGEAELTMTATGPDGHPLAWALDLVGGAGQRAAVKSVTTTAVHYELHTPPYQLALSGGGTCSQVNGDTIRLSPSGSDGKIVMELK